MGNVHPRFDVSLIEQNPEKASEVIQKIWSKTSQQKLPTGLSKCSTVWGRWELFKKELTKAVPELKALGPSQAKDTMEESTQRVANKINKASFTANVGVGWEEDILNLSEEWNREEIRARDGLMTWLKKNWYRVKRHP